MIRLLSLFALFVTFVREIFLELLGVLKTKCYKKYKNIAGKSFLLTNTIIHSLRDCLSS